MVCGNDQSQPDRPHRQIHRAKSHRRRTVRRGKVCARKLGQHLQPVDEQHPGLVHQPSTLVGPSDSGLVRRRRKGLCRTRRGRGTSPGPRQKTPARRGRARHLVLLRPGPLQYHGMAQQCSCGTRRGRTQRFGERSEYEQGRSRLGPERGRHQQPERLRPLPAQQRASNRLRHHLLLGRPDDHDDHPLHGQSAVQTRLHPRPGARRTRQEDE